MKVSVLLLIVTISVPLTPVQSVAADDDFVVGVFPRRNYTTTIKMFTPLASHLSRKIGRKVVVKTARDFKTFWVGVTENRYDLVHFNQYHYVKSKKYFGYRVIVKNEEFGKSTISGALVTRIDSDFKFVSDLKGRTIIFGGGRGAMMSYVVPTALLRRAGLGKMIISKSFLLTLPMQRLRFISNRQQQAELETLFYNYQW